MKELDLDSFLLISRESSVQNYLKKQSYLARTGTIAELQHSDRVLKSANKPISSRALLH